MVNVLKALCCMGLLWLLAACSSETGGAPDISVGHDLKVASEHYATLAAAASMDISKIAVARFTVADEKREVTSLAPQRFPKKPPEDGARSVITFNPERNAVTFFTLDPVAGSSWELVLDEADFAHQLRFEFPLVDNDGRLASRVIVLGQLLSR